MKRDTDILLSNFRKEKRMKESYEGYWFRSHQVDESKWSKALYKNNEFHKHNAYDDDDEQESTIDDRIANKENKKLLSDGEITEGIQEFLEVGMKYRINVEAKDNKYCLEIEAI